MSYEIGKIAGSTRDLTGSCEVTITAVDVKEVLSDFNDKAIRKSDLIDAILDPDVPTLKTTIVLDLSYDPSTTFWSVTDTAPLVKILGDPFTKITLEPDKGSPAALVASFLTALADRDEDAALDIFPSINPESLHFGDTSITAVLNEYYNRFTFQYIDTQKNSDGDTEVTFKISRPDFETAQAEQRENVELHAALIKPSLLREFLGLDTSLTDAEISILFDDLTSRIADAPCITEFICFTLQPDILEKNWILKYPPDQLYNIIFDNMPTDLIYSEAAVLALDQLLAEGSIDQAAHDDYANYYNTSLIPLKNAEEKGYSYRGEWSIPGEGFVDYTFDAATTTAIEYWLFFDQGIPEDTDFIYEWYNQGGTVLCSTSTDTVHKGDNCSSSSLLSETFQALLPPDAYRLVVKINDGTVITDEMTFIE